VAFSILNQSNFHLGPTTGHTQYTSEGPVKWRWRPFWI